MNVKLIPLFFAGVFLSCSAPEHSREEWVLGTFCRIDLFEHGTKARYDMLFDELFRLDKIMNASRADSELTLINQNAGVKAVGVSGDLQAVLERALYFAKISTSGPLSKAAFDPTVGPLVKLWGIGSAQERVPAQEEINAVLPLIQWQNVLVTDGECFLNPGMALDLGAIAKGYAADRLVALLQNEVPRALIDLGGNIYVYDKTPEKPRKIGIQNPFDIRGSALGVLLVENASVVTSGIYERYFEEDGVRYHHIFDTASGYPAATDLLSVTIIAESSMDADALSTTALVLGYEEGSRLVREHNAEAVFVFADKSIRMTDGARFSLIDESYFIPASSMVNTK
ncbi:MAG: FAD:protein FMN transferase [Treponema sp.]|nr:FAD:protein FMN transferase [Treponema sp.]